MFKGRIVEPCLANLFCGQRLGALIILHRAEEEHRAVRIVIRGKIPVIHDVIIHVFAKHAEDPIISPSLNGRTQPYACNFAQPSGIASFNIIKRNRHA